jgi:hypothetical protein
MAFSLSGSAPKRRGLSDCTCGKLHDPNEFKTALLGDHQISCSSRSPGRRTGMAQLIRLEAWLQSWGSCSIF